MMNGGRHLQHVHKSLVHSLISSELDIISITYVPGSISIEVPIDEQLDYCSLGI